MHSSRLGELATKKEYKREDPSFMAEVMALEIPNKFRKPNMKSYNGTKGSRKARRAR